MKKLFTPIFILPFLVAQGQTIKRLVADSTDNKAQYPSLFTTAGNVVFFTSKNTTNTYSLYKTDGTDAGTVLVSDLSNHSTPPSGLISLGDKIMFQNYNNSGNEPWVSDGTSTGTKMLKDMKPGSTGAGFMPIGVLGTHIYFTCSPAGISGLWKTDATEIGTTEVLPKVSFSNAITFNNKLFFWGQVNSVYGLYSIDAASSVQLVKLLKPGNNTDAQIAVASSKFYFAYDDSVAGIEPFVSDGTTEGTFMLKDINPGSISSMDMGGSSTFSCMVIMNDKLYFNPSTQSGRSIWVSDGTTAGTVNVINNAGTNPQRFCVASGKLFFVKENPSGTGVSNGTEAGTKLLTPTENPSGVINHGNFVAFNGKVVFGGTPSGNEEKGQEPWVSDGTDNGTFMLRDIQTVPYSSSVNLYGFKSDYAIMGNKFYMACAETNSKRSVWIIEDETGTGVVNQSLNQATVYPNPGKNQVNINIQQEMISSCIITNLSGKVIHGEILSGNQATLDVSSLAKGVYFYSIISKAGKHFSGRFIVE